VFPVFTSHILATDFNTVVISVCHCSTHEDFFSQPKSFLAVYSQSFDCHLKRLPQFLFQSKSKSHCDWRSVSKSWCRAPSGAHDQIFITVWQLRSCFCGGLSFVYAAGPCQRSLSRVRVPRDSRPYFTVSDLRLPFSSPPTTRRVMVEVFDSAFTHGGGGHCDRQTLPLAYLNTLFSRAGSFKLRFE
jgi:hypothetical protein